MEATVATMSVGKGAGEPCGETGGGGGAGGRQMEVRLSASLTLPAVAAAAYTKEQKVPLVVGRAAMLLEEELADTLALVLLAKEAAEMVLAASEATCWATAVWAT